MDFRWHRTTPSPHWHVIPPLERIQGLPDEILDAGWSLVLPIKTDCNFVNDCGLGIESKMDTLILGADKDRSEKKSDIVDEDEL